MQLLLMMNMINHRLQNRKVCTSMIIICIRFTNVTDDWHMCIQKAAATMILKIRQKHRIPLSVMDTIIVDVQSLLDVAISDLSDQVQMYLQQAGVYQEVIRGTESIFGQFPRVFDSLHTQQQQLSYFRSNFTFIVRRMLSVCT